tara:strand:- start:266 stop:460 length:195 start_codon:yes stop_codon:yes gene_type:complete
VVAALQIMVVVVVLVVSFGNQHLVVVIIYLLLGHIQLLSVLEATIQLVFIADLVLMVHPLLYSD